MKLGKISKIAGVALSLVLLVAMAGMPAPALANGGVILHPGDLTGSVSVTGYDITSVTVRAMDTAGVFSASTTNTTGGTASIGYTLTVEGGRDYYVIAEAQIVADDNTRVILPVHGPVTVPVGSTVTQDLSVNPAIISGTISTSTDGGNTIEGFNIYAYIYPPEFPGMYFYNRTAAYGLTVPGLPDGRDYTLLVAPGLQYNFYAYITVNGIQYQEYVGTVTAPGAGGILDHDFEIDVTAATISGTANLSGTEADVYIARVQGRAYTPYRYTSTSISDISSGAYTLNVDEGTWNVQPYFYYNLTTGDLSGKTGYLYPPTVAVPITAGQHLTQDLLIDPGYITGTFSLSGASTDIHTSSSIRAGSSPSGTMSATIHEETGEYMFVASPGDSWQYNYYLLYFDYPTDTDPYLNSRISEYSNFLGPYTVASDETLSDVDVTFGTATVRLLYYIEGEGELSEPYYQATREGLTSPTAYAYGSPLVTTEGQAIGTLLPGTWTIEAFATVEGSIPEFGTFTVSVEEGDVVVIGGPVRPTIKVTDPTDGEVIPDDSVTVEGTATDDAGIASITINGETVTFTSTGNPDDPNEVGFSHEVSLPVIGENTITVVATDIDETPPVTLTLTVIRPPPPEIEIPVDIKPQSCPNPLNLKGGGVLPVAILGTSDFDVSQIDPSSIRLLGSVEPLRWEYEDVATPYTEGFSEPPECLECTTDDSDGYMDLTLKFDKKEVVAAIGDVADGQAIMVHLEGELLDGTKIKGADVMCIIDRGK